MPNCGGNWNNGANAGVFYVNLNNHRSNSNSNIGFRSALFSKPEAGYSWNAGQCMRVKEPVSAPIFGEKRQRMSVCAAVCVETNKARAPLDAASSESESRQTLYL